MQRATLRIDEAAADDDEQNRTKPCEELLPVSVFFLSHLKCSGIVLANFKFYCSGLTVLRSSRISVCVLCMCV